MIPKKTKFVNSFRVNCYKKPKGCKKLDYHSFGVRALSHGRIKSNSISAALLTMKQYLRANGEKNFKIISRIFPHFPYTKKPLQTRMGGGKGNVEGFYAQVREGMIIFEIEANDEKIARNAARLGLSKLPISGIFQQNNEN